MLLEKAYAKLHGCYEAIAYGLIEKAMQETTSGAIVTLRAEMIPPEEVGLIICYLMSFINLIIIFFF